MIEQLHLPNDRHTWTLLLQEVEVYDFYHTATYHLCQHQGKGLMLYFHTPTLLILLPIVLRPIASGGYKDITSVYGYAGPLASKGGSEADILLFQQELTQWMHQNHVVSLFARLHPLIDSSSLIGSLGEIRAVNKTLYFDLTRSQADLWSGVAPAYRRDIRRFYAQGATIVEGSSDQQWEAFGILYHRAMGRLSAPQSYYFDSNYFDTLRHDPSCGWRLLLAYSSDQTLIGGAIISHCGSICQYHLGAVEADYLADYSPLKSLLWYAAIDTQGSGATVLHLGGGVAGSDSDGLFVFKSRLAQSLAQFSTWCWIIDKKQYHHLSAHQPNSDYFPLYRAL